jgi:hypothetical protein
LEGQAEWFVLARDAVDELSTWVLGRQGFRVPSTDLTRAVLTSAGAELEIMRRGDSFVARGSHDPDPSELSALLDEIGAIRPEAAVHVGPARPTEGFERPVLEVELFRGDGVVRWKVGAVDVWRGNAVHYARVEGIDATYVIGRAPVQRLLESVR